jgi:integrase
MGTQKTSKTKKGQVAIYSQDGYLRLRWRHEGKRYTIALGLLEHDAIAQQLAAQRANTIQLDILSGNFDDSLLKYKPKKIDSLPLVVTASPRSIYQAFLEFKRSQVSAATFKKYLSFLPDLGYLQPENILQYLGDRNNPETVKRKLEWLAQAYKYAGIDNPFEIAQKLHKVPPKLSPRPFTEDEVKKILIGFSEISPHYLPYVQFCLSTGARLQEVNCLTWSQISDNYEIIEILDFKRGKKRSFKLPELAIAAIKAACKNGEYVFTSAEGQKIDAGNFRNRHWRKVLEIQGIDYRRPYLCRSTAISHALASGASPMMIAAVTGHDVETLYRDYAGFIESSPTMPDLF